PTPADPALLLPPLVAAAAAAVLGGVGPGCAAAILALLAAHYAAALKGEALFSGPGGGLTVTVFAAGVLLVLVAAGRVQRTAAAERARRAQAERVAAQADRLEQLTASLARARTPAAAMDALIQETLYLLGGTSGALLVLDEHAPVARLAHAVGLELEARERLREVQLVGGTPLGDAVAGRSPLILESRAAIAAGYPQAAPPYAGAAAVIVLPLVVGSRVAAVLELYFDTPRDFAAEDREFLRTVGWRAAQALDRTWQYDLAMRARAEAEAHRARAAQELAERQRAEQALRASETRYRTLAARTSRLHALTAALSEAVTVRAVARAVIEQGLTAVGATGGELLLLSTGGGELEWLDGEPSRADTPARRPLESGDCAAEAIRTGKPVFVASFAEWHERYWRSAMLAADGGYASSATLPLLVEGRPIGVLAFHFTAPVNFDEEYRALLVSVAQHCAQALDRARLYEGAERARAEAEAASRLKDDFLSIVSHELRTPLNAILGWASMLRRGQLAPEAVERALQSIHDNATRQARLVDDLLDLSRIAAGRIALEIEEVDLRELLRRVVESVTPSAVAAGVELRTGSIHPAMVSGDLRRLEQIFLNLLTNAIKFTPAGGRVDIDATIDGRLVEISVADTGVGIDPDFLPHVFERFRQGDSTTTRSYGGLGLGLAIARQLVEAHGGTITVESPGPGRGSTFRVRLPRLADRVAVERSSTPSRPAAAQPPTPARLHGVRVLVVDDDTESREVAARALQAGGAEVRQAGSAGEALALLEREPIDVLLADIAMPTEDGYSLVRRLRASSSRRLAAIPAAAVTAHARDDERRLALSAGFQAHIAKPVEPRALVSLVERLAGIESSPCPSG
ncbi:MAG TPA: ATP-binding protein, partial [Vicinamibacterales bacterium]|nr:ATP-binding protein [Vicinamibacterales bacterium]